MEEREEVLNELIDKVKDKIRRFRKFCDEPAMLIVNNKKYYTHDPLFVLFGIQRIIEANIKSIKYRRDFELKWIGYDQITVIAFGNNEYTDNILNRLF